MTESFESYIKISSIHLTTGIAESVWSEIGEQKLAGKTEQAFRTELKRCFGVLELLSALDGKKYNS